MRISQEHLETFFEPIVGDELRVQAFALRMSAAQQDIPHDADASARYQALRDEVEVVVGESVERFVPEGGRSQSFRELLEYGRWRLIKGNGLFGAEVTVNALESVGTLYQNHGAQVPQQESRVRHNMHSVLGQVYGIAFADQLAGNINLEAYRTGLDPRKVRNIPKIILSMSKNLEANSSFDKSFEVHEDEHGQLTFEPTFRKLGRLRNRVCPATGPKTTMGERKRPSLWVFMQTIGGVAIKDIYSRQFDIVADEAT